MPTTLTDSPPDGRQLTPAPAAEDVMEEDVYVVDPGWGPASIGTPGWGF